MKITLSDKEINLLKMCISSWNNKNLECLSTCKLKTSIDLLEDTAKDIHKLGNKLGMTFKDWES